MISTIAICLTRPMPVEVAEVLAMLGLGVLLVLAVGLASKRGD